MNYLEMRWTPPPTTPKPFSPSDIYSKEVLENIPKTIENLWEIIDFRPPKDKESYIVKPVMSSNVIVDKYSEGEFGALIASSPRFIVSRRITDKERLEWLVKRYNDLNNRLWNSVIPGSSQGSLIGMTAMTVDRIDSALRKETK